MTSPKNAGKDPSYQMYPRDWNENVKLKMCSYAAQGLWIRLVNVSFDMPAKGVFMLAKHPLNEQDVLDLLPGKMRAKRAAFRELVQWNVIKQMDDKTFYCRRLRDDMKLRAMRQEVGKLGGNPNLVGNLVNQNGNQTPTPSTSTSSSPSEGSLNFKKSAILESLKKDHGTCFRWFQSEFETPTKRDLNTLEKYAKLCTVLMDDYGFNTWLSETVADIARKPVGYPGRNRMLIKALNNKIEKMPMPQGAQV